MTPLDQLAEYIQIPRDKNMHRLMLEFSEIIATALAQRWLQQLGKADSESLVHRGQREERTQPTEQCGRYALKRKRRPGCRAVPPPDHCQD